jgi:hypothetical protein
MNWTRTITRLPDGTEQVALPDVGMRVLGYWEHVAWKPLQMVYLAKVTDDGKKRVWLRRQYGIPCDEPSHWAPVELPPEKKKEKS